MQPEKSQGYQIITTPEQLVDLAAALEKEAVVGFDLEADSMFHFKERVCLVQLAAPGRHAILDTLALTDLAPLKPLFRDTRTRKIFHGADYDVRSLFRDFDIRIANLFDTQLACRFLGYRETGLEAVLKEFFAVALDKKYQRKDWSRRPLPRQMLDYAVSDARYLPALAERLTVELQAKGRLAWVEEECRILSKVRPGTSDGTPLFVSCKGAGRLDPRSLAVLEELLTFRRRVAREKDRPMFKVFNSESLLALAEARPATTAELEKSGALSPSQIERYGEAILAAIATALRLPAAQLPRYPRKTSQAIPAAAAERIQSLRRWRDAAARRLKIEPALVCSRAALVALALRKPTQPEELAEVAELRNWQRKMFAKEILAALRR
ncbi:MAG: HRDC domain-containing protein [Desulfobacterales bacterium]|jgi:ribonuclease D|nr:HRDC domain-containing protein [Desulfobacterales bacterium]